MVSIQHSSFGNGNCHTSLLFKCSIVALLCVYIHANKVADNKAGHDQVEELSDNDVLKAYASQNPSQSNLKNIFSRLQRAGSSQEGAPAAKTCTIEVQEVRRVSGHCMRLYGGMKACSSGEYMDPANDDCQ